MSDFLDAALAYAALGWRVFPLVPGRKTPRTTDGFKSATTDARQIRRWWPPQSRSNIGIATGRKSGIWVLDVDPQKGGAESLARLTKSHGLLPPTCMVRTPSGGSHYYFDWPTDGPAIRNRNNFEPGLDVRGEGGYVVAPPSVLTTDDGEVLGDYSEG